MMSTKVIFEDVVSVAQKAEYKNQNREFREKTLKEYEISGSDHGFSRKMNAYQMGYLELPGSDSLNGLDRNEKIMKETPVPLSQSIMIGIYVRNLKTMYVLLPV